MKQGINLIYICQSQKLTLKFPSLQPVYLTLPTLVKEQGFQDAPKPPLCGLAVLKIQS